MQGVAERRLGQQSTRLVAHAGSIRRRGTWRRREIATAGPQSGRRGTTSSRLFTVGGHVARQHSERGCGKGAGPERRVGDMPSGPALGRSGFPSLGDQPRVSQSRISGNGPSRAPRLCHGISRLRHPDAEGPGPGVESDRRPRRCHGTNCLLRAAQRPSCQHWKRALLVAGRRGTSSRERPPNTVWKGWHG
jgi:hypothetical protein